MTLTTPTAQTMKRWTDVTDDPNAEPAIRYRNETLVAARRDPVADRVAYLQEICRGKRVLDVGVVDHTLGSGQSLHRALASVASDILGVDVLEAAVEALRAKGFNVRVCDITRDPVDGEFDVMVCGEVIEHLDNPGGLFEAANRVLAAGGRLVLTTPNPFYMARARDNLRGDCRDSVDHVTLLFPSGIAEFAERHGLRLDRYRGVKVTDESAASLTGKLVLRFQNLLYGRLLSPDVGCNTMIYECVKPR